VEDRVLAAVRFIARARHTEIPIDTPVYWLYTIRAGRIVKMVVYLDRAEALEAAGLSEQGAHTSP
jgi:ketosteroid isomerase-like protein